MLKVDFTYRTPEKVKITGDFWKADTNGDTSSTSMKRVNLRPATWT